MNKFIFSFIKLTSTPAVVETKSTQLEIVEERNLLGKEFRIYGTKENPLFLAKDVANWIGHSNVTDMISRVDEEEVTKLNLGGRQGVSNLLTEDGFYEVLMQSRKPIAKAFKKEVKAINDHCRCITKCYIPHPQSKTKTLEVNIIPEGDIYRLVFGSQLPSAIKFEKWVMDEVLP